jgi:hypothetical protein
MIIMDRRPFGEIGKKLSIIGFGGIVVAQTERIIDLLRRCL